MSLIPDRVERKAAFGFVRSGERQRAARTFEAVTGFEPTQEQLDLYLGRDDPLAFSGRRGGKTTAVLVRAIREAALGGSALVITSTGASMRGVIEYARPYVEAVGGTVNLYRRQQIRIGDGGVQFETPQRVMAGPAVRGVDVTDVLEDLFQPADPRYYPVIEDFRRKWMLID